MAQTNHRISVGLRTNLAYQNHQRNRSRVTNSLHQLLTWSITNYCFVFEGYIRFLLERKALLPKGNYQRQFFTDLGSEWRKLSQEKKDIYNEPYREGMVCACLFKTNVRLDDKPSLIRIWQNWCTFQAKYNELIAAYKNNLTKDQKQAIRDGRKLLKDKRARAKNRKQIRDIHTALGKPKQPLSAYFLFVDDKRTKSSGKLPPAEAKTDWKNLSEEQKEIYNQKAKLLRDIYE